MQRNDKGYNIKGKYKNSYYIFNVFFSYKAETEPMVIGDCLISTNVANNIKTLNNPKKNIYKLRWIFMKCLMTS